MSHIKTIFVRVNPRMGRTLFFRAGIEFGSAWRAVDVDEATAAVLSAEQMLEVSEVDPNRVDAELKSVAVPEPEPVAGNDASESLAVEAVQDPGYPTAAIPKKSSKN